MSKLPKEFPRLLRPGSGVRDELKQKIEEFEAMQIERTQLDHEISLLRKRQNDAEDRVAEELAENEFQSCLRAEQVMERSCTDLPNMFNQHLGCIVDELAVKFKRMFYLDIDIRKLTASIESDIAADNEKLKSF
ncbi:uncharacterized protein LOC117584316 [Drosophila guanche]|uniref:uncharacterized protein LOC117584316 n=1 Tax=Drosophila guanche TaxID=7266 RepID=UPI0014711094|nr:uncharacterized protein LOC117584316 [Drosophila guanche]